MSKSAAMIKTEKIKNRWAFIVGVDFYRDSRFDPLQHCVDDVKAMQDFLRSVGYGVVCLHDDLDRQDQFFPDRADTVLGRLNRFCKGIGPDDLLLVYFACHGTRSLQPDDQQPYLIFESTIPEKPETALEIAQLRNEMAACAAQRQILLLDACHMGAGEGDRGDTREEAEQFIENVYELATGFALLSASAAQQRTKESADLGHGVFSKFVLEGLRGGKDQRALVNATRPDEKFVSVESLSQYVYNRQLFWAKERGLDQVPHKNLQGASVNFILVDYRDRPLPDPLPQPTVPLTGQVSDRAFASTVQLTLGQQAELEDLGTRLQELNDELSDVRQQLREENGLTARRRLTNQQKRLYVDIDQVSQSIAKLKVGQGEV